MLARVTRNAHRNLNGGPQAAVVEFPDRRQLQAGARREFLLFVLYQVLRATVDKGVRAECTGAIAVAMILDLHDSDERGEKFFHLRELQRRMEKCSGKQVSD